MRRSLPVLVALLAACVVAVTARADGDPASDVLPLSSVYFPISPASPDARKALTDAVNAVYGQGDRVRVAVIATVDDLGAVPSLMNKPGDYAKFLGQELALFYIGPLLIAMPNGWGIYDGGRPVASATGVLNGIDVSGSSPDDLVRSTAAAVQKLEAAGALESIDIRAPWVYPVPTTITPGRTASFEYRLLDDSDKVSTLATIVAGKKTLASLRVPLAPTDYPKAHHVRWAVPTTVPKKSVRLCMKATDAAGNTSRPACVALKVR